MRQRLEVHRCTGLALHPAMEDKLAKGTVDIADYEGKSWPCVPIAIPSKGREQIVCDQTLHMLKSYDYDMAKVHVFVDATHVRDDGRNEYDVYFHLLRQRGFEQVNIHPGGQGLRKQYERIFAFFQGEDRIILTSDMVPRIDWKRRSRNVTLESLPKERLLHIIHVGFDVCRSYGARAWSLASCKAGLNLQAGHISLKCGLLCGNFCGIRLSHGKPIQMTVSDYTTDVEFSVKCWSEDGAMVRFLGIAAAHKYRAAGGHRDRTPNAKKRHQETCKAIQKLASQYPKCLKYTGDEERPSKAMNYRFLQKGPKALRFKGTFSSRGRTPSNGWRHLSGAERMRASRLRHPKKNNQKKRT